MAEKQTTSPLYKQFKDLKKKHPDACILFRTGSIYEAFDEDAEAISQILGITLTNRSSLYKDDLKKMTGFPHHALDTYLPKLIRAGKRIAICDQIEPKSVKVHEQNETSTETKTETKMEDNTATQQQIISIAEETFKALNGKVPASLNKKLSDTIGELKYIRLKYTCKAHIEPEEIDYVLRLAEEGLKAQQQKGG